MPVSLTDGMMLARDGFLVTATGFSKLWFDAFDGGILVELVSASVLVVGRRRSMKPSRIDAEPSVASSLLGPATNVKTSPVPTLARVVVGERED